MWFVAALLGFSLAYALLRWVHPSPAVRRWPAAQVTVAAAVLAAMIAFLVWQRWPPGAAHTFMNLRWDLWPQGAVLFALGVWAGESRSLADLTAWAGRLGWTALAAAALFVAGKTKSLMDGWSLATETIDSGLAQAKLAELADG